MSALATCSFARAATGLTGWAWSDTIGWISLSCSNVPGECDRVPYGLSQSGSQITGWAWSDSIGWISANTSDLSGGPTGARQVAVSPTGAVSGWLRAIGATTGWDGWINLSNTGFQTTFTGTGLSGWAWGDAVIGWILFSADQPCAMTSGRFCDGNFVRERSPACAVTTISDCGTAGCSSVTKQCITPVATTVRPSGTFVARPTMVQPGARTTLVWDIANATQCSVAGAGDAWSGSRATVSTSPITHTTRYALTCTGDGGTLTATVDIRVAPRYHEI